MKELAAYHSLDLKDYRDPKGGSPSEGTYILVIGNAFAHKYVGATVDALTKAFPREKIVALGLKEDARHNVTAYQSGHLTDEQMHNLLGGAKVVVFPSHYEGFGIPVVESLAYSKPVLARSIPVIRDLRERLAAKDNLILYGSTKDLLARLREGFPKWQYGAKESTNQISWGSGTAEMGEFLRGLFPSWSFSDQLVPRLAFMRVLEDHRYALQGPLPGADASDGEDEEKLLKQKIDPREIVELRKSLRDRDLQMAELKQSLSWRITAPVRALGGVFMRKSATKSLEPAAKSREQADGSE
jgi:hypothetical protein